MQAFPVPFSHAIVAVDIRGAVVWEQGELDRRYRIASVTKVLVAMGAHLAVQAGWLSLEDPAGPVGSTVANLLDHSSGLAASGDGAEVAAPVGTRRIYSNQGYEVLGDYLARSTRRSFDQWLGEALFEPLGTQTLYVPGSAAHSGQGSALDLSLIVEELLDPQLLSAESMAAMTTPSRPGLRGILPGYGMQRDNLWGLGPEIRGNKQPHWTAREHSPQTFGHFGTYGSFLWIDPVRGLGAVFLGSEPFGEWHKQNWPALNSAILAGAA